MPDTNIGIQYTSVNETEPLLRDANGIGGIKCCDEGYEKSKHWIPWESRGWTSKVS